MGKAYSQRTTFVTAEQAEKGRGWCIVDAAGVPLGRVATKVASILRGKNRVDFTPHANLGDFVVVINASQVVLTGNKMRDKLYRWHTGYFGGVKEKNAALMIEQNPERVMELAVWGMLPKGPLGRQMIKKLKVYRDDKHDHRAQKPRVESVAV